MAKIVRYNGNLAAFASAAPGTERTLFGSVSQANDLTSQINADFLRGWGIVGPSDQPALEDFNAAMYTHGQLHAYLHQVGIAEYNATQEYHIGSVTNVAGVIYVSKIDNNTGNTPSSSPSAWDRLAKNLGAVTSIVRQVFSASGTYTPSAGMIFCDVEGEGGGGGGGGCTGAGGTSSAGGGGAAGGYFKVRLTAAQIGASKAVTIGAAGAAGAAGPNTGGTGGATSIGVLATANGGLGGTGGSASASLAISGTGGVGGTATGGDINIQGGRGQSGFLLGTTAGARSGRGADSVFGRGGYESGPTGPGIAGTGNGSGGSGGTATATSQAGGAGVPGFLTITEYCSV